MIRFIGLTVLLLAGTIGATGIDIFVFDSIGVSSTYPFHPLATVICSSRTTGGSFLAVDTSDLYGKIHVDSLFSPSYKYLWVFVKPGWGRELLYAVTDTIAQGHYAMQLWPNPAITSVVDTVSVVDGITPLTGADVHFSILGNTVRTSTLKPYRGGIITAIPATVGKYLLTIPVGYYGDLVVCGNVVWSFLADSSRNLYTFGCEP